MHKTLLIAAGALLAALLLAVDQQSSRADDEGRIVVDYPLEGALFPPDFTAPTFLWHDDTDADRWQVRLLFADGEERDVSLVPGAPPAQGAVDPEALGPTNEVYRPSPYQASARSWTPPAALWEELKRRSVEAPVTVAFRGVLEAAPERVLSAGEVPIRTSTDPVGAPIFYRDVPLMPAEGKRGVIKPLAGGAIPIIAWRLRDVSRPESKVVLTGMPSCANCHSFSADGTTLGMDVDGPQGDKGAYAIAPVQQEMVIDNDQVITWNSFPGRPEGHKTIGFLSRVSPDGKDVLSTVNEALYVANFRNYRFLQVFFPTRGILAWYSTETDEMRALPGADDETYVHCSPAWSPDGKTIVFSRAEAFDPYGDGKPLATEPNDPNEPRIRYDLHRVPFDEGRGGTAEPIAGASHNGMSNTFPKVSPDGRWIVWTKCRNGQLMRPDGKLWIVPAAGGEAREMRCNTSLMNSWHSFSPNSRWMVFSSKSNTPYTQMFLTHIDEEGNDTPAILVPNSTAANRAVNIPEFLNADYAALDLIQVPAVNHHRHLWDALDLLGRRAYAQAIPHLEKALAVDPDFGRALVNLGHALAELGRAKEAVAPLRRAVEIDPTNDHAHHNLGMVLSRVGELKEAEHHYHEALERNPTRALTWNNLGFVFALQERWDDAIEHYRKALDLDRDLVLAWKNLGRALYAKQRPADALAHFQEALLRAPDDPETHRAIAGLLLQRNAPAGAVPHLERALALDPADGATALQLAWLRATSLVDALRDGARAVELAEAVSAHRKRQDPAALDVLAAAYAEAGRFKEAVAAAREAEALVAEGKGQVPPGLADRRKAYEAGRPHRPKPRGP